MNTNTPQIALTGLYTNMYERVGNDFVQYQLTRRGLTNNAIAVNLSYAGTAVNGTDYTDPNYGVVTIPAGSYTTTFKLNPIDNNTVDGNRPFSVTVAAPTNPGDYVINPNNNAAPGLIIDDDLAPVAPGDVLFTDNFDSYAGTAANTLPAGWTMKFNAANNVNDYNFTFGYDYSANGIPAPPNTATTLGLKVTVNKNDAAASAAGINFYPVGQVFSNNFRIRFEMLVAINSSTGQTEYAMFGLNHSGTKTNWWRSTSPYLANARATNMDGLFFGINSSGADGTDYQLLTKATGTVATDPVTITSRAYTTMYQTFKIPPYGVTGEPGIAQNTSGTLTTPTWVDVEITQITNLISLRLDNTIVLQTNHPGAFTSGNVMLGYVDPYDSIGGFGGAVYYDNLSVVRIYPLTIATQPVSGVIIPAGNSTNLTVVTTGSATGITYYQWQRNGVAIPGATSATLALNNVQPANDGIYTVVVTDGVVTLTSTSTSFLVVPPGVAIGTGTGLEGGYWTLHTNTAPFTGSPTLTRLDPTVNFNWGWGSPDPSISATNFTARWVGQVQALGTENYTFQTINDDGVRLWVNDQLLIDSWVPQAAGQFINANTIALTGVNKYDIVMEYFQATQADLAELYWSNATTVGYSPVPQSQLYPAASVLPAIALTSPANGASYPTSSPIPLAASVTTNHNVIQSVAFYNGASLIGSVTTPPYQYSWSGVPVGSYNLTAQVSYNTNWTVVSATNTVTVTAPSLGAATISGIAGTSLNYSGGVGSQFVLLGTNVVSAPLTNWTRLATNPTPSGSFISPVGSDVLMFYRIKSE